MTHTVYGIGQHIYSIYIWYRPTLYFHKGAIAGQRQVCSGLVGRGRGGAPSHTFQEKGRVPDYFTKICLKRLAVSSGGIMVFKNLLIEAYFISQ